MRYLIVLLAIAAVIAGAFSYFGLPLPSVSDPEPVIYISAGILVFAGLVVVLKSASGWLTGKEKAPIPIQVKVFHVVLLAFFIVFLYYVFQSFMEAR